MDLNETKTDRQGGWEQKLKANESIEEMKMKFAQNVRKKTKDRLKTRKKQEKGDNKTTKKLSIKTLRGLFCKRRLLDHGQNRVQ